MNEIQRGGVFTQHSMTPMAFMRSFGFRGLKWQSFKFGIRNSGGVLQCAFFDRMLDVAAGVTTACPPDMIDRIINASHEWRALPTLTAAPFGNVGAGLHSGGQTAGQFLLLNTRPQPVSQYWSLLVMAHTRYQDTNTTRQNLYAYLERYDVVGSGQIYRPHFLMTNDQSSGYPLFSTGQIPAGKLIVWDIGMFVA